MRTSDGEKSKITGGQEPRDVNSNPWNDLRFDQETSGSPFSEKIPEVWKAQTFSGMPFTIEKCRDLK